MHRRVMLRSEDEASAALKHTMCMLDRSWR